MKTKNEVIVLLRVLGNSPEEVAESLHKLGIKGFRGKCNMCPITEFLRALCPEATWIGVTTERVFIQFGKERGVSFVPNENDIRFSFRDYNLRQISSFISRFDDSDEFSFLNKLHP